MFRPEHLAYFKELFEGRAAISWNAWFKQNEVQLSQELPRMDFLRLKFNKLDEAEKLLQSAGIEFTPSPLAKREKYYALLHDSVLDEAGRPKESFQRKAYGGAAGLFLDGEAEKGREVLAKFMKKFMRRPIEEKMEELDSFCFGGEMELKYGNSELGKCILELIAALETGDDLLDPSILIARKLLKASGT